MTNQEGTIEYLCDKGYGFIRPMVRESADDRSIYFHASCLAGGEDFSELNVGDVVNFACIVKTARGRMAKIVSLYEIRESEPQYRSR